MEYSKLVAVTGLPGLFELINTKSDGAIVRSLTDNTTRFAASRIHNFTQLESIEIYTIRENVNLVDVLNAMDKAGEKLPDEKDATAVKKYFEKVYPDMDFDRVYASDMKKIVKWFDVLKKNNIEIKLAELPEEEEEIVEEVKPVAKEKPAKAEAKTTTEEKTPAKKAATKKEAEVKKETKSAKPETKKKAEEKPAKKAAAKKK